jgi:hypothetical protein
MRVARLLYFAAVLPAANERDCRDRDPLFKFPAAVLIGGLTSMTLGSVL